METGVLSFFKGLWISFKPIHQHEIEVNLLKWIALKIRKIVGGIEHETWILRPSNSILSLHPPDVREWLAERKMTFVLHDPEEFYKFDSA
jgi:hypothetical protein